VLLLALYAAAAVLLVGGWRPGAAPPGARHGRDARLARAAARAGRGVGTAALAARRGAGVLAGRRGLLGLAAR
jgi:hypothetical protein